MMRDYNSSSFNPGLKKTQSHIFRNLALFIVIAILASVYFFYTEPEVIEQKQPTVAVTQLSLPEIASTTPDIIPPAPVIFDDTATNLPEPIDTAPEIQQTDVPLRETETVELPAEDSEHREAAPAEEETLPVMSATWETYTIKSGDSLANIFREWKLSPTTLHNIVTSSKLAKSLADIHPGETLKLQRDDDGDLLQLVVVRSPTESLVISKTETSYDSELVTRKVDIQHAFASGTINTSLFIDGQDSGLTDAQIMEMAGIFGWDIDFALELRKGDSFKLMYEEHFLDGEKLSNGPILMAEFHNNKKTFRAVRFTTPDGDTSYYDPDDGRNKKRTFLRTPVKFAPNKLTFQRKTLSSQTKKMACTPWCRLCSTNWHPGKNRRQRESHLSWQKRWVWQSRDHSAWQQIHNPLCTPFKVRPLKQEGQHSLTGTGYRIRWKNRPGNRSTPALRIQGKWRASQPFNRQTPQSRSNQ